MLAINQDARAAALGGAETIVRRHFQMSNAVPSLALAATGSVSDPSPSPSSVSGGLALDNHLIVYANSREYSIARQGREVEVLADPLIVAELCKRRS